ncbi:MAG: hypothetical protein IPL35_09735 [Sphingobacteriales bacterium]|nr:hypothetical protein [Sphingobacteriales bacterium]
MSRSQYRQRHQADFIQTLHLQFGDFFLIPEGGANEYGVQGCREIIIDAGGAENMDYWCAACGTGTMLAGMIAACEEKSIVLGFPALPKAEFLYQDIERQLQPNHYRRWTLHTQYAAPQYARLNDELLQFIRRFYLQHRIVLDAVYTAKMMYGIYDLIQKDYFPAGSRIAAVHSGGLQGWHGMLQYQQQLPEIPWQLIQ